MAAFLQFALTVTVERGIGARDGRTYLASFLSFRALSLYTIDLEVTSHARRVLLGLSDSPQVNFGDARARARSENLFLTSARGT